MFWYIFICTCLAFIYVVWRLSHRREMWRDLALFLMFSLLWFFSSFRATSVGADTKNYISLFAQLRVCPLSELTKVHIQNWAGRYYINWEMGFKLLMWLYLRVFFFLPARSGLAFLSFLILFLWAQAIGKQSPYPFLSVWLYVTLAFFQTSLNLTQNALAIAIIVWAIRFIYEEKPVKWLIAVAISMMIHNSSFIFFPLYWMGRIQFTRRRFQIWIFAIVIASVFSNIIIGLAFRFIPSRYYAYVRTDRTAWVELAVLLIHIALIGIVWLFRIRIIRHGNSKSSIETSGSAFIQPYFMFFLFEFGTYMMTLSAKGLLRVATLFSPAIIIYLPHLINTIESPHEETTCIRTIAVFSLIFFIARMMVNNIGTTQPYVFFNFLY